MFLAIDVGNSETSFGVYDERTLLFHWRAETRHLATSDQIASFLLPLLAHRRVHERPWRAVGVSSVVPGANLPLTDFVRSYLDCPIRFVSPAGPLPFDIAVDEPASVGADRLANAAYAVIRLRLPAVIVDFGTATTLDVISGKRSYEGGLILPGVGLSFGSLSRGTSQLASVEPIFPPSAIGRSTSACIQSGVLYGYCDQIEGLIARIERELGDTCEVRLTGGFGRLFESRVRGKYEPHLTLEGIRLLAETTD